MFEDLLHKVSPDNELGSLGYVCGLCQILPGQLRTVIEDLDIAPALILDGVPMFTGTQIVSISRRVNELRDEIRAAAEQVPSN